MKDTQGYTLMHEHLTIDLSGVKQTDDCRLDCFDQTVEEFHALYQHQVRRVVDVTNCGMGQNPEYAEKIGQLTGIEIVHATGFYKEPFLPQQVYEQTPEQLADFMVKELRSGIGNSDIKAGIIGEIGTSKDMMTELEAKLFEAACIAQRQTNASIYTHTTLGTYALEQVQFFKERQIPLDRVIIGHIDLSDDLAYILRVLETGVTVGFDTIGKLNYVPDENRVSYLKEIAARGFASQVVLSLDLTRKSHLKYKEGIGYSYLFTHFIPMLKKAGIHQDTIDTWLITNPQRLLGGLL